LVLITQLYHDARSTECQKSAQIWTIRKVQTTQIRAKE